MERRDAGWSPGQMFGIEDFRRGPFAEVLAAGPIVEVGADDLAAEGADPEGAGFVFSSYQLQDIGDYRGALQAWFGAVRPGGHLLVAVPHAFLFERQSAPPSRRRPQQRRLYTPRGLLGEIEEALEPNSYRIRSLSDDDRGYDYGLGHEAEPVGRHDVVVLIQKIAPPAWTLDAPPEQVMRAGPDFAFEPVRDRAERPALPTVRRIVILKLDHLGDFIMGVPALERARAVFGDAHITLVVGSWNHDMAVGLGLFDAVLAFDAFPRNPTEEAIDLAGKSPALRALLPEPFDLAVDLRVDHDTRFFLKDIKAAVRAGVGPKSTFDFLDIFLPIDETRNWFELARDDEIPVGEFFNSERCEKSRFHISHASGAPGAVDIALVWGPYRQVRAGEYAFEPRIEVDEAHPGELYYDIVVGPRTLLFGFIKSSEPVRIPFTVTQGGAFEFRLWPTQHADTPLFRFYGGRLMRKGAEGVLHQSEYMLLLVALLEMRLKLFGLYQDEAGRAP